MSWEGRPGARGEGRRKLSERRREGFNFSRRVVYTHGLICTSTVMAELISERI